MQKNDIQLKIWKKNQTSIGLRILGGLVGGRVTSSSLGLHTTPAASELSQSLLPQPSKRHLLRWLSSPLQYKLSIQNLPAMIYIRARLVSLLTAIPFDRVCSKSREQRRKDIKKNLVHNLQPINFSHQRLI